MKHNFDLDYHYMGSLLDDIKNKVLNQKNDLIKKRIEDFTGEDFDPVSEQMRKFPRIVRVIQGNEESYFWNDGTKDGLRLITFVEVQSEVKKADYSYNIEIELKHY
jgi:hypothetical protein